MRGVPNEKPSQWPGFSAFQLLNNYLELLVEVAHRARDINPAWYAALAVLYALDDARSLAALRTIRRLRRVHYFLAVTGLCDLCHDSGVSPSGIVSAHTRKSDARGFNGAVKSLPQFAK
jgi:hypothetical protein